MTEQMPLFEAATEPLQETEDVAPQWISWEELREQYGWTREDFEDIELEDTMSPMEPGEE